MANQPSKRVEFYGVDCSKLGLCLDSAGKVVGVDCTGYEIAAVEATPASQGTLGTWQARVRQSNFPGGGFAFSGGGDQLEDGTRGLAQLPISTSFLVLHTVTTQAGAVADVTFHLSTKSE